MKVFVINLDRVPDRWAFVRDQFRVVGLGDTVQRCSAIDARAPGFAPPGYAPHRWGSRWELTLSEQAIFESHRMIWRRIVDHHPEGGVICEDDILVSRHFGEVLAKLPDTTSGIVKLDGFSDARRYGHASIEAGLTLRPILEPVPSAACYFLTRPAAEALLTASQSYCATLDDFVFTPRSGLVPVQLFPAVSVQGMCCAPTEADMPGLIAQSERSPSDVQQSTYKGPLAYRGAKEWKRLKLRLARSMGADRRLLALGGLYDRPTLAADLPPYRA